MAASTSPETAIFRPHAHPMGRGERFQIARSIAVTPAGVPVMGWRIGMIVEIGAVETACWRRSAGPRPPARAWTGFARARARSHPRRNAAGRAQAPGAGTHPSRCPRACQRDDEIIAIRRDRQPDSAIAERGLERAGIELSGALVEQAGGESGKTWLAMGIVGRTGRQRERHRDHRQGMIGRRTRPRRPWSVFSDCTSTAPAGAADISASTAARETNSCKRRVRSRRLPRHQISRHRFALDQVLDAPPRAPLRPRRRGCGRAIPRRPSTVSPMAMAWP